MQVCTYSLGEEGIDSKYIFHICTDGEGSAVASCWPFNGKDSQKGLLGTVP